MTTLNASNNYPFITKAAIKALVATDDRFVRQCMLIMHDRQTLEEQERKETITRNKRGWMSSHAVPATKIAVKIALDEEALTSEEMAKARAMISVYSKQLASHFRQQQVQENPALAEAGRVFGV